MGEWKKYKLSDVCELIVDCVNKTAPVVDYVTPYKMIRTTNIKNGKINTADVKYVTEEIYKKWVRRGIPEINDVLLTREAPVGEIGIVKTKDKMFLGQRTMMYRAKKGTTAPEFLYYSLLSPFLQEQILSSGMGSVVEHIRVPDAKEFIIKMPSFTEQKSIASILSSLDDKIDLLHHQNKTLEALAETFFRQWFVEEAEKGWKKEKLADYALVATGKGLMRHEFVDNGTYPVLGANGEIGRTNNYMTEENLILTGRVGTLGKVVISEGRVWISDNVLIIKPFKKIYFYPIYFILKRIEFENLNVGSTQPLVTQTDLKNILFSMPNNNILEGLENQCSNFFKKVSHNKKQISTLTLLRDTLLPKLMSGEVRIKE